MRKFNQRNKHLKVMLVASDDDAECLGENIDLTILRGDGNWPGYQHRMLFGETVFPVCSPGYLKKHPQSAQIENLANLSLIHIVSGHSEWINWDTWLDGHLSEPTKIEKTMAFNTYPLAIQAAVDGLGIVLGWGQLVDHLLDSGALVRPLGKTRTRTEFGYYLLYPKDHKPFPERTAVENWLLKESASRKSYARHK
jgi:DNA-binding transcriptional LysR family regulator